MIKIFSKKKEIPDISSEKIVLLTVSHQRVCHIKNYDSKSFHLTKNCGFIEYPNGLCEASSQTEKAVIWTIV